MREPGYYWVKYDSEWEVAEFATFHTPEFGGPYGWFRTAFPDVFTNSDFEEIDERRIERAEKAILPDEPYDPTNDIVDYTCRDTLKEEGWGLGPAPRYISDNPYLCKDDE